MASALMVIGVSAWYPDKYKKIIYYRAITVSLTAMFKSSVTASARLLRADFLPPANEVCEGYVFTRACHSVHGGGGGGRRYPSMHCRWYPSMSCSRSGGGLQAHTQGGSWGVWPVGGHQAHTQGRMCIPACTDADPPPTATAAGGTHPTGMHSCCASNCSL